LRTLGCLTGTSLVIHPGHFGWYNKHGIIMMDDTWMIRHTTILWRTFSNILNQLKSRNHDCSTSLSNLTIYFWGGGQNPTPRVRHCIFILSSILSTLLACIYILYWSLLWQSFSTNVVQNYHYQHSSTRISISGHCSLLKVLPIYYTSYIEHWPAAKLHSRRWHDVCVPAIRIRIGADKLFGFIKLI